MYVESKKGQSISEKKIKNRYATYGLRGVGQPFVVFPPGNVGRWLRTRRLTLDFVRTVRAKRLSATKHLCFQRFNCQAKEMNELPTIIVRIIVDNSVAYILFFK